MALGLVLAGCGDWRGGLGAAGGGFLGDDGGEDATIVETSGDDGPADGASDADDAADASAVDSATVEAASDAPADAPYDGPPKSLGAPCASSSECQFGHCVDGVCCSTTCQTGCWQCDGAGTAGTCTLVANGQPDPPSCGGVHVCNGAGSCVGGIGQPCTSGAQCTSYLCVDGVCCDGACAGVCQACNVAGFVGTCSPVPAGQHDDYPPGVCAAPNQCDGSGACQHPNGTGCISDGQCISGHCVDGFCCNTACGAVCYACALPGSVGTCKAIPQGQIDLSPVCDGAQACNGAGACLAALGQSCMSNSDCASSKCSSGTCG